MPTAEGILVWATTVANDWRWLAIAWHVAVTALLRAVVASRRVTQRLLGLFLVAPLVSVAVIASVSGNAFNGLAFSILAVLLLRIAFQLPSTPVSAAPTAACIAGAALLAVGWLYPHFLRTETWMAYAYASPFGLLPCPTLAVVIGITLMAGGLQSRRWSVAVSIAGALYGLIGVFALGVWLDGWLLAGACVLGIVAVDMLENHVRAKDAKFPLSVEKFADILARSRDAVLHSARFRGRGAARVLRTLWSQELRHATNHTNSRSH